MKKFMMRYLMINCREATLLTAKKEEGKLSFMKKINLAIHTSMCAFCKKFETQTSEISKECRHVHAEDNLPVLTKEKIERMMEENIS